MKTISERALMARINRRLAKEDEQLHKYSGMRWWRDLGNYYIVDQSRNFVIRSHLDLAELAEEMGNVLRPGEVYGEQV